MLKNLAAKLGVDVETISGTGPNGAITKADIEAAGKPSAGKLSSNQQSVAKRVSLSHQQIPPINLTADIEMAAAMKFRKKHGVSFDAVFVYAAANVIGKFPNFLSDMDASGEVNSGKPVDVGIAIGVGKELFTPVVRMLRKRTSRISIPGSRRLSKRRKMARLHLPTCPAAQ